MKQHNKVPKKCLTNKTVFNILQIKIYFFKEMSNGICF